MKDSIRLTTIHIAFSIGFIYSQTTQKFQSNYEVGTGVASKIVDTVIVNPLEKIFHLSGDSTKEESGKNANPVGEIVENVVVEPTKEIADYIDRYLKPIFPGTMWCGAGDRARNGNDLGIFKSTDACCREHDNCDDNISALDTKHGLKNTGLFTRSNCKCDDKFYDCLKEAKTIAATQIGHTYFNLLRPKCFKEDHPATCASPILRFLRCKKYNYNTTEPVEWQWFDAKRF